MMPRKKFRVARPRGGLTFIVSLLIASAVFRIGDGVGLAIAKETKNLSQAMKQTKEPTEEEDVGPLLAKLLEREKLVTEREKALELREVTLERVRKETERNLASLVEAEQRLKDTMSLAGEAAESDLDRLTKVYETMKPKNAAVLFGTMDPAFAAGFLGRMKPVSAAAILSGLPPEFAYEVSLTLSGRNLNAPTD